MSTENTSFFANCDCCEFNFYDGERDEYVCLAQLDEDEMADFVSRGARVCRYFRPYDEYKTVRKQN